MKRDTLKFAEITIKSRCSFKGGGAYLHEQKNNRQEILDQQINDLEMKHADRHNKSI